MVPKDLREYLASLQQAGMLLEVNQEVDWNLEAACIGGMMQRVGFGRYGLVFNNIKGYGGGGGRLAMCLYNAKPWRSWERVAFAMGLGKNTTLQQFREVFVKGIRNPIKPMEVSVAAAPCKEVIKVGKDVNLLDFPFPFIHSTDGGRYSTEHGIINQDPDTGWINYGLYRFMVKGPRRGGALWTFRQHGPNIYYLKYEARGKTMPFCLAIGGGALNFVAATLSAGVGVCEYDLIGGLMEEPMEVVRAETNNLLVPARAEIILEGEVRPRERTDEGPFGEYVGFTHGRNVSPIFRINCVTYRKNPIIPVSVEGCRWAEPVSMVVGDALSGWEGYVSNMGFEGVECWSNGDIYSQYLFKKEDFSSPQEKQQLAQASYAYKQMVPGHWQVMFDRDANFTDTRDLNEEIALNFDPRDHKLYLTDQDPIMYPLSFYTDAENRFRGTDAAKLTTDCTTKFKDQRFVPRKDLFEKAYPEDLRSSVEKRWTKLGFDEPFEIKEVYRR